jgi:hypothetical protein
MTGICGRTCGCDEACPRAERMAEDRKTAWSGSDMAVDQEQGRYERSYDDMWRNA